MDKKKYEHLENVQGHPLYDDNLDEDSVIFDCGSYKGLFSVAIVNLYGCKLYLYDPLYNTNITLYNKAKNRINYRNLIKQQIDGDIFIHDTVISDRVVNNINVYFNMNRLKGTTLLQHDDTSKNINKFPVKATTIEHEIERYNIDTIEVLKLDIEGAEINVICSLKPETLKRINQISVEWHIGKGLRGYNVRLIGYANHYLKSNGYKRLDFTSESNEYSLFVRKELVE